jgi:hypothetical protein
VGRLVERAGEQGVRGFPRLEDLLGAHEHGLRQLGDGGRSVELTRQRLGDGSEREDQVLELAWDAQAPGPVAQVAAQLAQDGRHRERRELRPALGVESIDRLHQAEARDLHEILTRVVASAKTRREPVGQRHELLDQGVPRAGVPAPPRVDESCLPADLAHAPADPRFASCRAGVIRITSQAR